MVIALSLSSGVRLYHKVGKDIMLRSSPEETPAWSDRYSDKIDYERCFPSLLLLSAAFSSVGERLKIQSPG